ncbi:phosphatase PAP2 family protein [Paraherbaspirillum soli]|uniref:Phosphatase PAP2 family protein n=1 Tax=Paraherbaspirillum soli TaxID=631222 RepID=A0ABW0M9H3_9BURK
MEQLNHTLFLLINASAHPTPEALAVANFLAETLIYGVPLLLTAMWLWGTPKQRAAALTATMSIGFALACSQLISAVWPHPRPFMIGLGNTFLDHQPDSSFPSDHATVIFTLGFSLCFSSLRRFGIPVLLLGIPVGWARVYLGVHFPFDMIGALCVAVGSGWLVVRLLANRQLGNRALSVLEIPYRAVFALPIAKGWVRR